MRITKDTPLDDLWELRRYFSPRWAKESAMIKAARSARGEIGEEALAAAELAYEDFETVATSVIAICDLKQQIQKLLQNVEGTRATEELTPEERDRRSQASSYDGPDMTPDGDGSPPDGEAQVTHYRTLADVEKELVGEREKAWVEAQIHISNARKMLDDVVKDTVDVQHEVNHAFLIMRPVYRKYTTNPQYELSGEDWETFRSSSSYSVLDSQYKSLASLVNFCINGKWDEVRNRLDRVVE